MDTATLDRAPLLLTQDDSFWKLLDEVPDAIIVSDPYEESQINKLTRFHGHLIIKWKRSDPKDVDRARKTFEELKVQGYTFFVATWSNKPGKPAFDFDSKAKKYVFLPPATKAELEPVEPKKLPTVEPKAAEATEVDDDDDGKKHQRAETFDPRAKEYVASRPLRGG